MWLTYDIVKNLDVDICASAVSIDGTNCPADGTYNITTMAFPMTSQFVYLAGMNIATDLTISDSAGNSLGCAKTTVKLSKSA